MTLRINWEKIKTFAIAIAVPVVLGGLVGLLISGSMDYETLNKPPLAPPGFIFPIVWTILYVLMGVSYAIIKREAELDTATSALYYCQLGVNLLWPIFFFVLKWRLFAFIWIVVLALLVIIMAVRFYKRDQNAGLLQLPYVFWTLFASYLNLMIFILN